MSVLLGLLPRGDCASAGHRRADAGSGPGYRACADVAAAVESTPMPCRRVTAWAAAGPLTLCDRPRRPDPSIISAACPALSACAAAALLNHPDAGAASMPLACKPRIPNVSIYTQGEARRARRRLPRLRLQPGVRSHDRRRQGVSRNAHDRRSRRQRRADAACLFPADRREFRRDHRYEILHARRRVLEDDHRRPASVDRLRRRDLPT